MKTWKQLLIFMTILAGVCSSCSNSQPQGIAPTATIFPVTSTPTNTPNTPITREDFTCWPVKLLQEGNDFKGSFVYAHYDSPVNKNRTSDYFVWNIRSFRGEKLEIDKRMDIVNSRVSFNGSKITLLTKDELVFMSYDNIEAFSLPEKAINKNLTIKGYLSPDGRLLISEFRNYKEGDIDYKEGIGFTDTYYIFDPQSRSISTHTIFLPGLYMDWEMRPVIYYSPDMSYVLYRSTPTSHKEQFTLYDIEKAKIVWTTPPENSNWNIYGFGPHWMPNSEIITAEFIDQSTHLSNYYYISLNGKITPVNDLEYSPGSGISLYAPPLDWSPNGRYLVLSNYSTFIWDNQTKIYYKPCLPNEKDTIFQNMPIWSFDSAYFMVTLTFLSPKGENVYKKYILDLANKTIFEMPENVNQGEFSTLYKGGRNDFLGWVNWEIP